MIDAVLMPLFKTSRPNIQYITQQTFICSKSKIQTLENVPSVSIVHFEKGKCLRGLVFLLLTLKRRIFTQSTVITLNRYSPAGLMSLGHRFLLIIRN